jgi:acetyl esterase
MVDNQVIDLLEEIREEMVKLNHPPLDVLTPQEARYFNKKARKFFSKRDFSDIHISNNSIEVSNGEINLRTYYPTKNESKLPILIYFHGGGWVFSDLDSNDYACCFIARNAECIVISVGYRLAPEHKYPIPFEDCYEAVKWVFNNTNKYKSNGRIAIGGESSGANMAAGICQKLRNTSDTLPFCQFLITPPVLHAFNTDSYNAGFQYNLTKEKMQWFWRHYLKDIEQGKEPYASPLLGDAKNLPPALIYTVEYDPLRDEGLLYAQHLQKAQVEVKHRCFDNLVHSFIHMAERSANAQDAFIQICRDLKEYLYT